MSQVDDIIKNHLQAASAAQRHVYVAGSNYDDNLPHLQYLAAQSDLDQATAKMMFWCLGGRYLAQFAPEAITDELERARVAAYVQAFDAEFLQLAYQIAIHGRDELPLAPDEYTGFTMTLLRLHAFRPEQPAALGGPGVAQQGGVNK